MAAILRCPYPRCRQRLRIPKHHNGSICCPRCRRFVIIDGNPVELAEPATSTAASWLPLLATVVFLVLVAGSAAFFVLRPRLGTESAQPIVATDADRNSTAKNQSRLTELDNSDKPRVDATATGNTASAQREAQTTRTEDHVTLLDQHALSAPPEVEGSITELANYLRQPVRNDWDAARVVYRWVTDRIAYDADAFFRGRAEPISAATALRRRKCVCAGYSALFAALGRELGLEVVVIEGKAIGAFKAPRGRNDHAWNAVKIDGRWHLVDATWGAGVLEGKKYVKRFTDAYFLIAPERLIYSHFPDDPQWQLLDPPLSRQEFERLPRTNRSLLSLFKRLPLPQEILRQPKGFEFVEAFNVPDGGRIRILQGPVAKNLGSSVNYSFRIAAPKAVKIAAINNERWHFLTREGEVFSGRFQFDPGQVKVAAKLNQRDTTYWSIVHYRVRK